MRILKNIPLAQLNTFHTGGKAEFFAKIKKTEDLKKAIDFARSKKLNVFILGGGSNILLSDEGIKGLVLKMEIGGIKIRGNFILAGAGEEWDKVVAKAARENLGGIENLSLIPGTVGGAVYQNIGAYSAELKDILESVTVWDMSSNKVKKLSNKDCYFGYRTSIFQKPAGKNYIILKALLRLSQKWTPNISYPDLVKYFEKKKPTISGIRKAVMKIRKNKLDYPTKSIGTAGSFFKNPTIVASSYQRLASSHPDIKSKNIGGNLIKLSAGQLIEKAGWKGRRIGNVGVSARHALVLVSYRGGKSTNIIELARTIQKSVKVKFGVNLELEVKIPHLSARY